MDTMLGRFIALVVVLITVSIVLLAGALWAGRRWVKRHPSSKAARQEITPTGLALCGCQTLLLFGGLAARELEPDGPLGEFLATPAGVITYLVCLIVGFSLTAHALRKLGYPVARERMHRTDESRR